MFALLNLLEPSKITPLPQADQGIPSKFFLESGDCAGQDGEGSGFGTGPGWRGTEKTDLDRLLTLISGWSSIPQDRTIWESIGTLDSA